MKQIFFLYSWGRDWLADCLPAWRFRLTLLSYQPQQSIAFLGYMYVQYIYCLMISTRLLGSPIYKLSGLCSVNDWQTDPTNPYILESRNETPKVYYIHRQKILVRFRASSVRLFQRSRKLYCERIKKWRRSQVIELGQCSLTGMFETCLEWGVIGIDYWEFILIFDAICTRAFFIGSFWTYWDLKQLMKFNFFSITGFWE